MLYLYGIQLWKYLFVKVICHFNTKETLGEFSPICLLRGARDFCAGIVGDDVIIYG